MNSPQASHRRSQSVPIHSLGISQIIAYGLLFYVFALLKTPLAQLYSVSETYILILLSIIIGLQALLAPVFGYWADRFSAVLVMVFGLICGGAGLMMLGAGHHILFLYAGFVLIGLGVGGATYELAFAAAVQLDEQQSRKNISYITFYGAVASSLSWLIVGQMLSLFSLHFTLVLCGLTAWSMAGRMAWLSAQTAAQHRGHQTAFERLRFSQLEASEKAAMVLLAIAGGAGYLGFGAASMMWISWFDSLYANTGLAVVLASIYGPFQLVGRVLEMRYGSRFDARLTGAVASVAVPAGVCLAQFDMVPVSLVAMALFGMGQGVITVTTGFVANLYFRAEIYGRAKGWISLPKTLGLACGPLAGGLLYTILGEMFLWAIMGLTLITSLSFFALLRHKPTNHLHEILSQR